MNLGREGAGFRAVKYGASAAPPQEAGRVAVAQLSVLEVLTMDACVSVCCVPMHGGGGANRQE